MCRKLDSTIHPGPVIAAQSGSLMPLVKLDVSLKMPSVPLALRKCGIGCFSKWGRMFHFPESEGSAQRRPGAGAQQSVLMALGSLQSSRGPHGAVVEAGTAAGCLSFHCPGPSLFS